MRWILGNHIKTRREFKIFYKKSIGVLSEITLGNIKKEKLNLKKLVKGNKCHMSIYWHKYYYIIYQVNFCF